MNDTAAIIAPPEVTHLPALSLRQVLAHVQLVQEIMQQVLKEGEHYGPGFPGDKKKNLHKPGAEKLCLAFGLVPHYETRQSDFDGGHREYTTICSLRSRNGQVVADGVGLCSTLETKYRYRTSKRRCPACGEESIIKTNKGRNPGGYWCVPDKGGCGANYNPGDQTIEGQESGKIENPDIADCYNTVLKMAAKRALVHATIQATAAGDIFCQDAEDMAAKGEAAEARDEARQQQPVKEERPAPPKAEQPATAAKSAAPAAATTSAAKEATTTVVRANAPASANSTTPPVLTGRPQTMPKDGPRPACEAWYADLKKQAGESFAKLVWQSTKESWQLRFDTLREMVESGETILRVLGETKGNELLGRICGDHTHDEDGIQAIRQEMVRSANGEVTPAPTPAAAATTDEEPPF